MAGTVYVIDESNNNGRADLAQVKAAGIQGWIGKVTEGTGFADPTWVERAQEAHSLGLVVGGYHFGHPEQNGVAQAQFFLQHLAAAGVPTPVRCADVEIGAAQAEAFAVSFVPAAHINLGYSGLSFAVSNLRTPLAGVDWWLAAYGQKATPAPPWGVLAGWQFTDSWLCPGTNDRFDMSMFDANVWAQLTGGGTPGAPSLLMWP